MLKSCAIALALLAPTGAQAESVWIGGASGSGNTTVAYGGVVLPLPGRPLSDGWSQSVFVDHVRYEYDSGPDRVVGNANGLKYSIGREYKLASGFLGLSLGASLAHTGLSPDDPGNRSRGSHLRAVGELQWRSVDEANWQTRAYLQYVPGARRSLCNGFVGRRLGNGLKLGPQVSSNGDPSYQLYGLAIALSGMRIGGGELGVYAGAQHAEGGATQPEIGLSFVRYLAD